MASLKDRSRILTQKSIATWNVVNITSEVALGPPPVAVLDDQTRIVRHGVISRFPFLESESTPLEQREDRSHPSGADLIASPTRARQVGAMGVDCHSLFSNEVEAGHG